MSRFGYNIRGFACMLSFGYCGNDPASLRAVPAKLLRQRSRPIGNFYVMRVIYRCEHGLPTLRQCRASPRDWRTLQQRQKVEDP